MHRIVVIMVYLTIGMGLAQAGDYPVTLSFDSDEEALILRQIHEECARRLSSGTALPGFCSQNAMPDDQNCTCTPNANQRGSFIKNRAENAFREDRGVLRRQRGREIAAIYHTLSNEARQAIDAAAGLTPLP